MAAGATLICDRCLDSPSIAAATAFLAAGQINWRLAIALTGIVAAVYGGFISSASKTRLWQGLRALRQRPRVGSDDE